MQTAHSSQRGGGRQCGEAEWRGRPAQRGRSPLLRQLHPGPTAGCEGASSPSSHFPRRTPVKLSQSVMAQAHGPAVGRRLLLAAPLALLLPARFGSAQPTTEAPRLDVPYVPTPQSVVERMLEMGGVGPDDVLYDLGCGDGRIVVTAAKKRGARGV